MKKLFQALVTTYLLAPCSALAINPFRSVDEARTFFNKERTFGKPGPVELSPFFTPMPPYDYDSGPIVKQRPVLAFPSFDPKATEQLNLCIYKINHTAYDPDDRSMKGLDEIRKHVENGADFTNWLSPSPILDRYADQNQHHAPLLKALLDRGAVLYDYDFYLFDQQPHDIQQLLLANCKGITNSGGENFLHQCTYMYKPESVYNFCRHGVDATQQDSNEVTPLHTLMTMNNFSFLLDLNHLRRKLMVLEKVAALTWKHAQLSAKNNAGKTPLDLLTGEAIGLRQDVERIAKATEQERDRYIGTQQETPLLLKQHIAQALVPIVMGYAQPTWLHDIWPKIKDNAAKITLEDRAPAPLGMRARIWRALQVAFALRNNK